MKKTPTLLPPGFLESEKGNTFIVDCDGGIAAWINLDEKKKLEITYTPGNSPMFYVAVVAMTDKKLFKHLNSKRMLGWVVVRANFDGAKNLHLDTNGTLVEYHEVKKR